MAVRRGSQRSIVPDVTRPAHSAVFLGGLILVQTEPEPHRFALIGALAFLQQAAGGDGLEAPNSWRQSGKPWPDDLRSGFQMRPRINQ